MTYELEYFNLRTKEEIISWPKSIKMDYARLVELLIEFGPDLRMPNSRALGEGLFELSPPSPPQKDLKRAYKRMNEVNNG